MNNIGLIGNPNSGKTSLFNAITGSYAYVGNWTGVTVEKKVGRLHKYDWELTDLPGIYSINPVSADESVAVRFLLYDSYDCLLNLIDASQLSRSLHLTVQLMELGKPMVVALNMMDVARSRSIEIDTNLLAERLGIPLAPVVARTGKGCPELIETIVTEDRKVPFVQLDYGDDVERAIQKIVTLVGHQNMYNMRWLAVRFLEGNVEIESMWANQTYSEQIDRVREELQQEFAQRGLSKSVGVWIRNVRQQWIDAILAQVERRSARKVTKTAMLDAFVTHPALGMIFFLLTMFLMFKLTFDWVGTPLSDQLSGFLDDVLSPKVSEWLTQVGASDFLMAVVTQGIIAGVGGVLVFVPQIFMLFFLISVIEDSGYMARIAFVMDRILQVFGLNGKAFIPMIIGFGCNVPGVMAARTIEQPRERLITMLLTPLMSCSARLPVYSLFAGTFFATNQAVVVFSLYVLGILVALLLASVFSKLIFRSEASLFFIELPPYRVPQALTLWRSTWEKGKGFIRKAGTFIFGGSVIIWLLGYAGPAGLDVPMNESFLALIGGIIAPLFDPLGFGNWQAGVALITGFLAKEVVVSTMNIIYAAPDMQALSGAVGEMFTPLQAYSFMVFVLLYIPCIATVAVIHKESGSSKWTWFSIGYSLIVAYLLAWVIYQGGLLLGFN